MNSDKTPSQPQHNAMLQKLLKAESLQPSLTFAKCLTLMIAVLVYAASGGLIYLAIQLFLDTSKLGILGIILGLLCLDLAWVMRPRFGKWPTNVLDRDEFPTLYELADRVADALDAAPVYGIVISLDFNAAFRRVGWENRSLLTLGYPLLSILNEYEMVALVAHELAHGVNGDFSRTFFVASACNALEQWGWFFDPRVKLRVTSAGYEARRGIISLLAVPSRFLLYILRNLMLSESRRAEYYADALAASITGSDTTISLLRKLELRDSFYKMLRQTANWGGADKDLFKRFQNRFSALTPAELQQMSQEAPTSKLPSNSTHPPIAYRIALLEAHRVGKAQISMEPEAKAKIESELTAIREEAQHKLLQLWNNRLI